MSDFQPQQIHITSDHYADLLNFAIPTPVSLTIVRDGDPERDELLQEQLHRGGRLPGPAGAPDRRPLRLVADPHRRRAVSGRVLRRRHPAQPRKPPYGRRAPVDPAAVGAHRPARPVQQRAHRTVGRLRVARHVGHGRPLDGRPATRLGADRPPDPRRRRQRLPNLRRRRPLGRAGPAAGLLHR